MLTALQVEFSQPQYNVTENDIIVTLTLQANESARGDFNVSLLFQSMTAGEHIDYSVNICNLST